MIKAIMARLGVQEVKPENTEQLTVLTSQVTELTELVTKLNTTLEETEANLQNAVSKLAEFELAAQEAKAQAVEALAREAALVLETKRAKLAAVMGTENPSLDTTFNAVSTLSDEAFNVVVEGFRTAQAVEAKSVLFNEVGAQAEADKTGAVKPNATMQMLTEKYKKEQK